MSIVVLMTIYWEVCNDTIYFPLATQRILRHTSTLWGKKSLLPACCLHPEDNLTALAMLAHVNPRIPAMKTHQSIKMTGVNNIVAIT